MGGELLPSEEGQNPSSKPNMIQVGSWCAKERQSSDFIQITQNLMPDAQGWKGKGEHHQHV